jgi:hypothetical protein
MWEAVYDAARARLFGREIGPTSLGSGQGRRLFPGRRGSLARPETTIRRPGP